MGGQGGPDRDALLLPAGQRSKRAVAQVGEAQQVQDLLDALAHDRRVEREVLHRVRELLLDDVRHEPGDRVLADIPDDVGQLARRMRPGVAAIDGHRAGQRAAGEVGDQPVDGAEERGLARTGRPDDEAELALLDPDAHVAQDRRGPNRRRSPRRDRT